MCPFFSPSLLIFYHQRQVVFQMSGCILLRPINCCRGFRPTSGDGFPITVELASYTYRRRLKHRVGSLPFFLLSKSEITKAPLMVFQSLNGHHQPLQKINRHQLLIHHIKSLSSAWIVGITSLCSFVLIIDHFVSEVQKIDLLLWLFNTDLSPTNDYRR